MDLAHGMLLGGESRFEMSSGTEGVSGVVLGVPVSFWVPSACVCLARGKPARGCSQRKCSWLF